VSSAAVNVQVTADVDVPPAVSADAISDLIDFALAREGAEGDWSIGVRLTSDVALQRMHQDYMGIDTPTDIMTFPYGGGDIDFPGLVADEPGGDLVISVDRAGENAELAGWSVEDELAFLVVHGILHLLGWNDLSDRDRGAMLARQQQLLADWTIERPAS